MNLTTPSSQNHPHVKASSQGKLKRLFLIIGSILFAVTLFAIFNTKNIALAACSTDDTANFLSAGELQCGKEVYKYDPVLSLRNGYPSFVEHTGDALIICSAGDAVVRSINSNNPPCDPDSGDHIDLEHYSHASEPFEANGNGSSGGPFCSLIRTNNCQPWNGNDYDDFQGSRGADGKPQFFRSGATANLQTLNTNVDEINEGLERAAETEAADRSCEDGLNNPLSFVLCPINNFITSTLTTIIETLTKLLENPKLTGSNSLKTALGSMVTLANSFYILIFLFIIIANFVAIPGLDNYTIKKTLPKLIAAIILTQFSLLICQTILDLGNILAVTLPTQILQAFHIPGTPAEAFAQTIVPQISNITDIGDLFEELGKFMIFQLTMIVGIIVAIIAFFYLLVRYLFLIGLVLACPIAFAMWVLPNTEQFFKKWWAYFIKLSIMFLLVNLLFVMGAVFVKLLADGNVFSGAGPTGIFQDFFTSLISIIVPIIVLLLVPKTLKVSGDIMSKSKEAVGKAYNNAKDSRAGKAVSKSAQEGKLAEVRGGAQEKFGKSDFAKKRLGHDRAALIQARGSAKKDVVSDNISKKVETLDFDDQLKILNDTGGKGKAGEAAKRAIGKKRDDILNKRVLNNGDLEKLEKLEGAGHFTDNGKLGVARTTLPAGSNGYVNNPFIEDSSGGTTPGSPGVGTLPTGGSPSPSSTGSTGGFPGGTGSPSGGTGSTPSTPLPPPTPTGGPRSSGGTTASGTPSGATSRRTGARPTPTPPPTSPPTPSSLPSPEPPEPPPTTE